MNDRNLIMQFKDHFSGHASDYAQYRPTYPDKLFQFLAKISPDTKKVWDCATGNGQAALVLTNYFDRIIATDASAQQIENAFPHEKIEYRVAPAERSDIESQSCDLVVVAQALHWFDFSRFFAEAQRVLKSDGVLAVSWYTLPRIDNEIDREIDSFYSETVGEFWPPERRYIESGFKEIHFPVQELVCPVFEIRLDWNLFDLCGYLNTWSAVQKYIDRNRENPVEKLVLKLQKLWGDPNISRKINYPLFLKAGKFRDEH